MLTMTFCKKVLAVIWITWFALLFLLLFVQTYGSKYGDKSGDVWNWFLPMIFPTVTLMIGVLILDARTESIQQAAVDKLIFILAAGGSVFYLLILSLMFLLEPYFEVTIFEQIKGFGTPISVIQGIVNSLVGVFFMKRSN